MNNIQSYYQAVSDALLKLPKDPVNELPARYQNLSEKLIAASREVSDPVWKNKRWHIERCSHPKNQASPVSR